MSSTYLTPLLSLPGVEGAVLSGPDGLSVESHGNYTDLMAAELTALRHMFERTTRRGGLGGITRMAITAETLEIIVVASGPYLAAIALTRGVDTRHAQQTLARIALELSLPDTTAGQQESQHRGRPV